MAKLAGRSVAINYARSSIRLEPELWGGFREVCERERWTEWQLIGVAEAAYPDSPRTSAVRAYLFVYFYSAAGGGS